MTRGAWGHGKPVARFASQKDTSCIDARNPHAPHLGYVDLTMTARFGQKEMMGQPLTNGDLTTVMAMAISYNWLFLWDYTFYKWGYKYL